MPLTCWKWKKDARGAITGQRNCNTMLQHHTQHNFRHGHNAACPKTASLPACVQRVAGNQQRFGHSIGSYNNAAVRGRLQRGHAQTTRRPSSNAVGQQQRGDCKEDMLRQCIGGHIRLRSKHHYWKATLRSGTRDNPRPHSTPTPLRCTSLPRTASHCAHRHRRTVLHRTVLHRAPSPRRRTPCPYLHRGDEHPCQPERNLLRELLPMDGDLKAIPKVDMENFPRQSIEHQI